MARIAIDIDSTLHDYWPLFEDLALQRHGVRLRYEDQANWNIDALDESQVFELVSESHSPENILAAKPYPHAAETISGWRADGHWIHITSHRRDEAREATERWLRQAAIPYDDLHCSFDKVARCAELGIDVLIDDSPVNLRRATERGIAGATLVHPWNAELVERDGIVGARDWRELEQRLAPLLAR